VYFVYDKYKIPKSRLLGTSLTWNNLILSNSHSHILHISRDVKPDSSDVLAQKFVLIHVNNTRNQTNTVRWLQLDAQHPALYASIFSISGHAMTLTFDLLTLKPNQLIFVPGNSTDKSLMKINAYHRHHSNNITDGLMYAHRQTTKNDTSGPATAGEGINNDSNTHRNTALLISNLSTSSSLGAFLICCINSSHFSSDLQMSNTAQAQVLARTWLKRTYSNYGDTCSAAAGPRLWNSLPADLRQADISFEQFKRLLKTFLFGCWDRGTLWLTVNLHLISSLTYLLTYLLTKAWTAAFSLASKAKLFGFYDSFALALHKYPAELLVCNGSTHTANNHLRHRGMCWRLQISSGVVFVYVFWYSAVP